MSAKTIMIQGTGSHVGKSVLTAALCRIFLQDGYRVAPFKSQNMALNSFVTEDGVEMGRAQVVQAEACGIKPCVDMNPILLKPSADTMAQVIVKGKPVGNMTVEEYIYFKKEAMEIVRESLDRLMGEYDIIVIEGAGSPAEINLKSHDIVNMGIAEIADAPVLLVGDIDKGGVFAWFVGTMELLSEKERERVKGFIINKFRGRRELLDSGITFLEERTGKKVMGVIPYFRDIRIMEEDSVSLTKGQGASLPLQAVSRGGKGQEPEINIDVIMLPHISNFTDFDPLEIEPDVNLRYIRRWDEINSPDMLIIPGSKNTISDLLYLKSSGLDKKIMECANKGVTLIGICGGYQMLGKRIIDKDCVESPSPTLTPTLSQRERERGARGEGRDGGVEGFGLLDMNTEFHPEKITHQVKAVHLDSGIEVSGYEIHMGKSNIEGSRVKGQGSRESPVFKIIERSKNRVEILDGLKTQNGNIWGTYIHGIFENDIFRRNFIDSIRIRKGLQPLSATQVFRPDMEYDKLAEIVRNNMNMDEVYRLCHF
ncbi:MAG: cobyric acid synthase [Nitrospinae bacterium]|nr:cobyric acid synthase [Nitrospinota bacterium]